MNSILFLLVIGIFAVGLQIWNAWQPESEWLMGIVGILNQAFSFITVVIAEAGSRFSCSVFRKAIWKPRMLALLILSGAVEGFAVWVGTFSGNVKSISLIFIFLGRLGVSLFGVHLGLNHSETTLRFLIFRIAPPNAPEPQIQNPEYNVPSGNL